MYAVDFVIMLQAGRPEIPFAAGKEEFSLQHGSFKIFPESHYC
jgi:hypothetical protein